MTADDVKNIERSEAEANLRRAAFAYAEKVGVEDVEQDGAAIEWLVNQTLDKLDEIGDRAREERLAQAERDAAGSYLERVARLVFATLSSRGVDILGITVPTAMVADLEAGGATIEAAAALVVDELDDPGFDDSPAPEGMGGCGHYDRYCDCGVRD